MTNIIDLREKSIHHKKEALARFKNLQKTNGKFSAGDIIEFWAGYNNDIRYRTEIIGVIGDDLYLSWDCYWFPIQDDKNSMIAKVA